MGLKLSEPCLSGQTIINSRQSLEEIAGADVVERALAGLPEEEREQYLSVEPESWVPVRIADEVQRAVAREAGIPVGELAGFVRAFSHRSVERMVSTVWKVLLRFTSDKALVERTPELFSNTYNVGRLSASADGPGKATVTLEGWPDISDEQMIGTAAGIEAVLQTAGRKNVEIRWQRTPSGALYAAKWTP
jgi:hypothetical protein